MGRTDDEIPGGATGTLLVVDDDESNRDLLARRLERRGHTVVTAEGGRGALELVAERPFDVVLLDVMMPEMSGLEVLQGPPQDARAGRAAGDHGDGPEPERGHRRGAPARGQRLRDQAARLPGRRSPGCRRSSC